MRHNSCILFFSMGLVLEVLLVRMGIADLKDDGLGWRMLSLETIVGVPSKDDGKLSI